MTLRLGTGTVDRLYLGGTVVGKVMLGSSQVWPTGTGTVYYVAATGADANDGRSQTSAWKTLTKVNATAFQPGDSVLFRGGDTFAGAINLNSGGLPTSLITVGSYGTGRATISSTGSGMFVQNHAGIVVQDIDFVGSGALGAGGAGVYFYTDDGAKHNTVTVRRCSMTGFTMGLTLGATNAGSGYSNVTLDSVITHDNRDNGIFFYGPALNPATPAYAHSNVLVTGCSAYNNQGNAANTTSSSGSGILLGSVQTGTVDLCSAYNNGKSNAATSAGPVGIWTYDADSITISRSVAYNNGTGTIADGHGIDLDIHVTNSSIERCLAYSNYGAGILVFGGTDGGSTNRVHHNLCWGNGGNPAGGYQSDLVIASKNSNLNVFNNTVVSTGAFMPLWVEGTPTAITLRNNLLVAGTGVCVHTSTAFTTSQVLLQGNDYWRPSGFQIRWGASTYTSLASWRSAATGQEKVSGVDSGFAVDPLLISPGTAPTVTDPANTSGANGLRLQSASPMVSAGLDLPTFGIDPGALDYFGNTIASPYSIGANDVDAAAGGDTLSVFTSDAVFTDTMEFA